MEKALDVLKKLCLVVTYNPYLKPKIEKAISELEEAIAEIEAMKPKTCEGCKHKPNEGECYYEHCGTCSRFFYDHYSPKGNQ